MKKLLCKLFNHNWVYKTDDFHLKYTYPHRYCSRCGQNQEFSPTSFKWQNFSPPFCQIYPVYIKYSRELFDKYISGIDPYNK